MRRILILASNPKRDLALDREIRDLEGVIRRSKNRDDFDIKSRSDVRSEDLQGLLLEHEPQIVHFCGHGTGEGLVLEDSTGREQIVPINILSDLFELFSGKVECVLLNACYSEQQADAIVKHVNYVVGMNQAIRDDAAISFALGFYQALGYGRAIEEAYRFGRNAIGLMPSTSTIARSSGTQQERKLVSISASNARTVISEHSKPVLKKRPMLVQPNDINTPPAAITSDSKRAEIDQEICKALEQEAALKQYRDRVRDYLTESILTPEEKAELDRLARKLRLKPAEATTIFQEEEQLRFPASKQSQALVKVEPQPSSAATVSSIQPLLDPTFSQSTSQPPPARRSWLKQAILLGGVLGVLGAGVAFWGYPLLVKDESAAPTTSSTITGQTESAAAEILRHAEQQASSGNFVDAIAALIHIAPNQPTHAKAQSLAQDWYNKLLTQLQATYDQGRADEAIDVLKAIPPQSSVSAQSQAKSSRWQQDWDADQTHLSEIQRVLQVNDFTTANAEIEKMVTAYWKQQANIIITNKKQGSDASIAWQAEQEERLNRVKQALQDNDLQTARAEAARIGTPFLRKDAKALIAAEEQELARYRNPQSSQESTSTATQTDDPQQQTDQAHFNRIQEVLGVHDFQTARAEAAQIKAADLQQQANDLIAKTERPAQPTITVDSFVTQQPPECYQVKDSTPLNVRSYDDPTRQKMGREVGSLPNGTIIVSEEETAADHPSAPRTRTWVRIEQPIAGWISKNAIERVRCPDGI